jgi:CubicO group peptidase (beta-lactamase class C family)
MSRLSLSRRVFAAGALAALATPAAARGLDAAALTAAADRARGLDQLNALVVWRDGAPQLEERLRGPGLDRPANVKSVSKSIMASLAGAALDRGVLEGVDQPVAPLLRDMTPAGADPRVAEITVDHLLTMRAGLERTSGAAYGQWVSSRNWVADQLSRPFVDRPGGRFLYSTGSFHLLSAALTRASGRSTLQNARAWLGGPLGVEIAPWTRDPQGVYLGGDEMTLTPRAMARYGEMHRLGGVWDGRRVLSRAWIEASFTPRTLSPFSGDQYGYGWFLRPMAGTTVAYARGYGGRMIYVAPGAGMVVAITSDPTRPARSGGHVGDLHGLVEGLIAAVA